MMYADPSEMYHFFILHEDISSFCRHVVEEYGAGLKAGVYFIDLAEKKITEPPCPHFSKAMYFRLLILSLFKDWECVLYLDVAILACSDIRPIFNAVENDKAIAATRDSSPFLGYVETILTSGKLENYFNSGVIVFNCYNISE